MKPPRVHPRPGNLLANDYVRRLPIAREIKPGRVYVAVFYHDAWCPQGTTAGGLGPCCCTPDVEMKEVPGEPAS